MLFLLYSLAIVRKEATDSKIIYDASSTLDSQSFMWCRMNVANWWVYNYYGTCVTVKIEALRDS